MFEGCEEGGCGFGWVAGVAGVAGGHCSDCLEFREIVSLENGCALRNFRLESSRRINECGMYIIHRRNEVSMLEVLVMRVNKHLNGPPVRISVGSDSYSTNATLYRVPVSLYNIDQYATAHISR